MTVRVGDIRIGEEHPLVLIAGPCVIEGEAFTLRVAERLKRMAETAGIGLIFKSSYDKANRSALTAYRGPGLETGLRILERVKRDLELPVLSDVHSVEEAKIAAGVLDVLQIPAFLCRQTDLVVAAAATGRVLNIKKGQFLAPWDMQNVVEKAISTGNRQLLLTERGVTFGYNNLVADMRSLIILRDLGYPVVFDATHSLQRPGGAGTSSGGDRAFIPHLARAGVATGCDAIFMEVHPSPETAPCDGPNMLRLEDLPALLPQLIAIDRIVRRKEILSAQ
ncbi:MAG: 3-deoxy-8-phosphooctulonate synthase [Nitrospinota bacterium]|nr:MAG: 3-deoxy-8-phosphooctulonate synthase [Nitrospinota bacterium]